MQQHFSTLTSMISTTESEGKVGKDTIADDYVENKVFVCLVTLMVITVPAGYVQLDVTFTNNIMIIGN